MTEVKSRLDTWLIAVLLLSIVVGIFFRGYHLEQKTFWEDEIIGTVRALGYTEAEIVRSAPQIVSAADLQKFFRPSPTRFGNVSTTLASLASEDPQHTPLFYVLNRLWVERIGATVTTLRTLPAFYGCLAIVAMYWVGIELYRRHSTALIASALLGISPIAVLYSQEAREYSMWTLAVLVGSAVFLRACRLDTREWWFAYAVAAVVGFYVFPLTALVIAGHGLYLAVAAERRSSQITRSYLFACLFAGLLCLPWLASMNADNGIRGIHTILSTVSSPKTIVLTFWRDIKLSLVDFGYTQSRWLALASSFYGIVFTIIVSYAIYVNARAGVRERVGFLLWGFVGPFIPVVVHDLIYHGVLVFQARYFVPVYLSVGFALASFFGATLDKQTNGVPKRVFWGAAFLLLVSSGVFSCAMSAKAWTWYNKDYERTPQVAALINHMRQPLLIADRGTSRVLGLGFYLNPSVAMSVNLHCDNCSVRPSLRHNLLADRNGYSDIVMIGRGPDEGSSDEGFETAIREPARHIIIIRTRIFPRSETPLNMFAATY